MEITIFGYYGMRNTGDELILRVLAEQLPGAFEGKPVRLGVLPSYDATQAYDPDIDGLRVLKYANNKFLKLLGIFPDASQTDLLVIGGGGVIQDHENMGARSVTGLLKRALLVRFFGGMVVLLGVGVVPLMTRSGKLQTRLLCRLSSAIVTRDTESAEALADAGVPKSKIVNAGDLVLLWAPPMTARERINDHLVQNQLVVSLLPYHKERQELFEVTTGVRKGIARALDGFLDKHKNATVVFVSFQGEPPKYDQEEADAVIALMRHSNRCITREYDPRPERVYEDILNSSAVVGMRLHSIVLACMAGKPFIAVSYHDKVASFAKAVGRGEWVVSRERVNSGLLESKLHAMTESNMKATYSDYLPLLRQKALLNFETLRQLDLPEKSRDADAR